MKIWETRKKEGWGGKNSSSSKPLAHLSLQGTEGHVCSLLPQRSVNANEWWVVIHLWCSAQLYKSLYIRVSWSILWQGYLYQRLHIGEQVCLVAWGWMMHKKAINCFSIKKKERKEKKRTFLNYILKLCVGFQWYAKNYFGLLLNKPKWGQTYSQPVFLKAPFSYFLAKLILPFWGWVGFFATPHLSQRRIQFCSQFYSNGLVLVIHNFWADNDCGPHSTPCEH